MIDPELKVTHHANLAVQGSAWLELELCIGGLNVVATVSPDAARKLAFDLVDKANRADQAAEDLLEARSRVRRAAALRALVVVGG